MRWLLAPLLLALLLPPAATAAASLGAAETPISSPCQSIRASFGLAYDPASGGYLVNEVRLHGVGCQGQAVSVDLALQTASGASEFGVDELAAAALNDAEAGPLVIDVSSAGVSAAALDGLSLVLGDAQTVGP